MNPLVGRRLKTENFHIVPFTFRQTLLAFIPPMREYDRLAHARTRRLLGTRTELSTASQAPWVANPFWSRLPEPVLEWISRLRGDKLIPRRMDYLLVGFRLLADRRVFLLPEHRDHWLRVQGENMFTANREWDVCFPGVGTPLLLLRQIYCDLRQAPFGPSRESYLKQHLSGFYRLPHPKAS